jgi:hypothetical protein
MSDTCCTQTKPNGDPCAARPLPDSDCCLFHDPAHAEALAEARRKGGSTPRRRLRRFPRLLDHVHVAELLGELFIEALNHTDVSDTKRLQTLTNLSRALLKAVGTPPTFLIHSDRREPAPTAGHLLRVYPPATPEGEALLEAEPVSCSEPLNARTPEPLNARTPEPLNTPTPNPQPPTPDPLNARTPECLNAVSPGPALPRARMPELRDDRAFLPGDPSLEIGDYDLWWGAVFFCPPDPAPAPRPAPVSTTATPDPTLPFPGAAPTAPGTPSLAGEGLGERLGATIGNASLGTPPLAGEGLGERSAEQDREHPMNTHGSGI